MALGNRTEAPGCLVEQAVNGALGQALAEAEKVFLTRLNAVTLAALSADFHRRVMARGGAFQAAHPS